MAAAESGRGPPRIVVAGDLAVDWIGWEHRAAESRKDPAVPNWRLSPGMHMVCHKGGVLLLRSFLENASWGNSGKPRLVSHVVESPELLAPSRIVHSNTILGKFPTETGRKDTVWRVKRHCGFSGPAQFTTFPLEDDPAHPHIVVLDDAGNGFRDHPEAWPSCIRDGDPAPLVVLKMSRPLCEGKLWKAVQKRDPAKVIVLVTAGDLRESGVFISHRLSWERSVSDLLWQLKNNRTIASLASAAHLVVRFGAEGALSYRNTGGAITATIFYTPRFLEDGFPEILPGNMQGMFNAFTAALVPHLMEWNGTVPAEGIQDGIRAGWRLFRDGYGPAASPPGPPGAGMFCSSPSDPRIGNIAIPPSVIHFFDPQGSWTILETAIPRDIGNIAAEWIRKGKSTDMEGVPLGIWGRLVTIDRSEIESFQSVRTLIRQYLDNPALATPLCIAVFGPPGAGKSFGVKQLASSIDAGGIRDLTFILSQAETPDALPMMFHKIRDEVLRGRIPLVFFDEFDTPLQGHPFGWLKYFLAPMQDGEFRHGEEMHPIGRSIFIFAGGTCPRFDEFSRRVQEDALKQEKGTDFISRLKGYVNIKGVNRSRYDDQFYLLRRGMLLRSLLEREAGDLIAPSGEIAIADDIVRAFLDTGEFLHGARSMEAILRGSALSGKQIFDQSALPPRDQLRVHVDADEFMRHLLGSMLLGDQREVLARKIHENYLHTNDSASPAAARPWSRLPEDYRDSNRRQADDTIRRLRHCGYAVRPAPQTPAVPVAFSPRDVERMAIMEHERWMEEKISKG